MEPRILLSGSLGIDLTAANNTLVLNQTGIDAFTVDIDNIGPTAYAGYDSVVINGLGGNDTITLNFNGSSFVADINVYGGDGNDSLLLSGNLLLGGKNLFADAEFIKSEATISDAGSVTLRAESQGDANLPAGETLDAAVLVTNSITASSAVVLSAQAGKTVIDPTATAGSYIGTSSATVDVTGAGTILTGSSVAVTARNSVQINAALASPLPSSFTLSQTNKTRAALAGGASVSSTGATTISAVDDSSIDVALDSTSFLGFDFGLLTADITLDRTTLASVDGDGTGTLAGAGPILVEASNDGGIAATTTASLVGTALNTGTDRATARVAHAGVGSSGAPVGSLAVRATNAGSYEATGKVASNTIGGGTTASIDGSDVFAGGAGGIVVSATDSVSARAHSTPIALDVSLIVADLDIALAVARNVVDRTTEASVTGSELDAGSGHIAIDVASDRTLATEAESTAVSGQALLPAFVSVGLAGLFSENRVRGNVSARSEDSKLSADGDVLVSAADTSLIDAKSELSASAKTGSLTIGAVGVAGGVSIAFNAVGWDTSSTAGAIGGDLLTALLGTDFGVNSEDPLDVEAYMLDTNAEAGGDVTVRATSAPQINATVSNAAESTASSLFGATGGAAGGILASNRLSGGARASIDYRDTYVHALGADIGANGTLTVQAENLADVYANAKVVSSAITTNDGGAEFARGIAAALVPDFDTGDGLVTAGLSVPAATLFGIKVRVEDGYANGGEEGRVYRYLGTATSLDLGIEDYSDLDFWKEELATSLIPAGFNVSKSNSVAVGGMVVYNDVRGGAQASIEDAVVQAGEVLISAVSQATIEASADNSSESSGGSSFNGGGASVAANATIATNNVTGGADAWVTRSVLSATGDVALEAKNDASISADVQSAVTSAGDSVGVLLAFNAVGHAPTNLLFNALDALIALPLGSEDPSRALATVTNSAINSDVGAITLTAENTAGITATVGNEATSLSEAMFGASAMSATGVLASNKVSSRTKAEIVETDAASGRKLVAGGAITLSAEDRSTVDASTSVGTSAKKGNDLGAGLLNSVVDSLLRDYRYTSLSGTQNLQFGDLVRLGSNVTPELQGRVAQYMGQAGAVDLGAQDYSDFEHWKLLDDTNVVPKAVATALIKSFGLDNGTSNGYYGLVTRNEVKAEVASLVNGAALEASADIVLRAAEKAGIRADDSSVVASQSGNRGGVLVNNMVLASALAQASNSRLTSSGGDIALDARNEGSLEAISDTKSATATTSSAETVGVVVALNTLGWAPTNLLFAAIDALIGDDLIPDEQAASATARLTGSAVSALVGDVTLDAVSSVQIAATVGNEQRTSAVNEFVVKAKFGANGMAAGGMLASNKVSSTATAAIENPVGDVVAGGVRVHADDATGIQSTSSLVTSAVTSNNLDAVKQILAGVIDNGYQFTTASGSQLLESGLRVRLGASHASGGIGGEVYEFIGAAPTLVTLGSADYDDTLLWQKVPKNDAGLLANFPNIGNLTDSNARAFGALVVLNDVRSMVLAEIKGATVLADTGDITVTAAADAQLAALAQVNVEASGGSAYGTGTVVAGGGQAVTNRVQSAVDARVRNSALTAAGGSVRIEGENTSLIDATVLTAASSGDTAVGVTLAFNSVGWESQNLLFNALDALIGRPIGDFDHASDETITVLDPGDRVKNLGDDQVYRFLGSRVTGTDVLAGQDYGNDALWALVADTPFGNENPARVSANVLDSLLDAGGDIVVTADNEAFINATMSNAASSAASALINATGKAFGGILASNKVSSESTAWIDYSVGIDDTDDVTAGGGVRVEASDNAGIYANVKVVTASATSNDGGLGLASQALDDLLPVDWLSSDAGPNPVKFGDLVQLADDFGAGDFSSDDGVVDIAQGDLVSVEAGYGESTFTSLSGVRLLRSGDVVQLADDYDPSRGEGGAAYRFLGEGARGLRVDLGVEDYTDTTRWQAIGGSGGAVYEYLGTDTQGFDLQLQDYSDETLWREIVGSAGDIYQYMGEDAQLEFAAQDFGDIGLWKLVPETQAIPSGISFTPSDSIAVAGLVVMNDVRSAVTAFVHNADLSAGGPVEVRSIESAVIRAESDAATSSSGGNVFGKGKSLAVSAVVATNVVLSTADASIEASDVTTTGAAGDVDVVAQNLSQIDAFTRAAASSGAQSASFLLAFNSVGYEANNVLYNAVDTLLGASYLATEKPARAHAWLLDTQVDASGSLTVNAESAAQINALVTNDATSYPAAWFGAEGMSASGILASNRVSSSALASIDYSDPIDTTADITTGGDVTVQAADDAAISAESRMFAEVAPTNDAATGILNNLVGLQENDYQYTTSSGVQDLAFGDKVLVVADDIFAATFETDGSEAIATLTAGDVVLLTEDYDGDNGTAGSRYQYIGADGDFNLGSQDYTDTTRWVEVGGTYQYMGTAAAGLNTDLATADYTDYGLWKRLNPANLITDSTTYAALNVVGTVMGKEGLAGDSNSYYGLIDLNDVRSTVIASITDARVQVGGDIAVTALESARITALEDSYVVPWTGRGGIIATNLVLSKANAFVEDSDLTSSGSVTLYAENLSLIDASATSKVEAWDSATAVVAFNSIGWKAQNILFNAVDALLGDPLISSAFNGQQPAEVQAWLRDTRVDAGGDINVTALSTAQTNAYVGNENISEAALDIVIPGAMEDASSVAGGGILASNKVSSFAKAFVEFTGTAGTIEAAGALTVQAEDSAGITSESVIIQQALTSNTLAGVVDQINALLPGDYDYTTESGEVTLVDGDRVRLGPNYVGFGEDGAVYRYEGGLTDSDPILDGTQVDLGTQDYTNATYWTKLVGGADNLEDLYPGIGNITKSDATAVGILVVMNDVRSAVDAFIDNTVVEAGAPMAVAFEVAAAPPLVDLETRQRVRDIDGSVYEFLGESGEIDLQDEDFADEERWLRVESVNVRADETAFIQSTGQSTVVASGGSFYGKGTVVAVNGQVVTNVVLSSADAYITDSEVTTTGGGVDVAANNTSTIDASLLASTSTGDTGVGVSLAFNSIGWQSQNFLFNALDTIIGRPGDSFDYESTDAPIDSLTPGERVRHNGEIYWYKGDGTATDEYTLFSKPTELVTNDLVRLNADIVDDTTGAVIAPAGLYKYIGTGKSDADGLDLNLEDFSATSMTWVAIAEPSVDLSDSVQDYANSSNWAKVVNPFSNEQPARVQAYILNSALNADGDLNVTATSTALINATVSNVADSVASALYGAKGKSVGAVVASNKVSSDALAYIRGDDLLVTAVTGAVDVFALDNAGIYSNSKMVASSMTTNDGGAAVLQESINDFQHADHQSSEGAVQLEFGERVRLSDDYASPDFTTDDGEQTVDTTTLIEVADGYDTARFTDESGRRLLVTGDIVQLGDGYDQAGITTQGSKSISLSQGQFVTLVADYETTGAAGDEQFVDIKTGDFVRHVVLSDTDGEIESEIIYRYTGSDTNLDLEAQLYDTSANWVAVNGDVGTVYAYRGPTGVVDLAAQDFTGANWQTVAGGLYKFIGTGGGGQRFDLATQDYGDATQWARLGGEVGVVYRYIGAGAPLIDLGATDYSDTTQWKKIGGPGEIYQWMGDTAMVDLTIEDYTDLDYWKEVLTTSIIPTGYNISKSDSIGVGALIVLNDVRSDVDAYVRDALIDAGSLSVTADLSAVIRADADSAASASGGSALGKGTVVAVNGTIATNLVLSSAKAYVESSDVSVTGDLAVNATNLSQIDAQTRSATSSGDKGVGVTLAFNTVGWEPQNVLFNALDTLIGPFDYDYRSDETSENGLKPDDLAQHDGKVYRYVGAEVATPVDLSNTVQNYASSANWEETLKVFAAEQPAEVRAYVSDTVLDIGGDMSVAALSEAVIDATVSNDATSAAVALKGANALAVGVMLAKNMVSSDTRAYVEEIDALADANANHVAGDLTVSAEDAAGIGADTSIAAQASVVNDYGLSIGVGLIRDMIDNYQFTSKSGLQEIDEDALVRVASDYGTTAAQQALRGKLVQYTGSKQTLDLGAQDYTMGPWEVRTLFGYDLTEALDFINSLLPTNLGNGQANASAGLVVRNDVRGLADARVDDSVLRVGDALTVSALQTASIIADNLSTVEAKGINKTANFNGVIAANLVLSEANAIIEDCDVLTRGGGVTLEAQNTSFIDATTKSSIKASGVNIGVTLAFNTVGYASQNLLFDLADTLFGLGLADVQPAQVRAQIIDSTVVSAGAIDISAVSCAVPRRCLSTGANPVR